MQSDSMLSEAMARGEKLSVVKLSVEKVAFSYPRQSVIRRSYFALRWNRERP
jgi:hypothetical protein